MRCERSIGQEPVRADSGVREVENKYLPSQSASSMPAKRNEKGVFFYSGFGGFLGFGDRRQLCSVRPSLR